MYKNKTNLDVSFGRGSLITFRLLVVQFSIALCSNIFFEIGKIFLQGTMPWLTVKFLASQRACSVSDAPKWAFCGGLWATSASNLGQLWWLNASWGRIRWVPWGLRTLMAGECKGRGKSCTGELSVLCRFRGTNQPSPRAPTPVQ